MTFNLTYIGADPGVVGVVPLPEGWPAANHDEPDQAVYAAKIAHGSYRQWRSTDGDEPQYAPSAALQDASASESQQDATVSTPAEQSTDSAEQPHPESL